ncbi:TIGR03086 family metal-binding protein [Plantactinospora solaniradicis]|uniref:TIGR03086 family metal-binding protein n=1 Tax=Plantactinospora solaniradicis TaxID=1723736 RepID=A0ABW1KEU9_9ACTN
MSGTITISDWRAVLAEAHTALRNAVAGVGAEDQHLRTPCEQWSVAQVIQHATGDQMAFTSAITGGPGPSENPFTPSGQIDGEPQAILNPALDASAEAWATVEDDAPAVANPLPQGPMPAWLAGGACALDAAVHAWDIAMATGQPSPLTPELARPLMVVATNIVEPLRAYGAYAPALDTDSGADDVAVLLRYLGRPTTWTR